MVARETLAVTMLSRLTFEITRNQAVSEPHMAAAIVIRAQMARLRGELRIMTNNTYAVVVEGERDEIVSFQGYIESLGSAIGEVSAMNVNHGLQSVTFPCGVKMVFPE